MGTNNNIKESKVAEAIKRIGKSNLPAVAVGVSLFAIGVAIVWKIAASLWFIILLFLKLPKAFLFILILSLVFGGIFAYINLDLIKDFLF